MESYGRYKKLNYFYKIFFSQLYYINTNENVKILEKNIIIYVKYIQSQYTGKAAVGNNFVFESGGPEGSIPFLTEVRVDLSR